MEITPEIEKKYNLEESGWTTTIYIPVTLRQVEEAKLTLNSNFGCDDEEHEELLDDPTILRLAIYTEVIFPDDIGENKHPRKDISSGRRYDVECLCARIGQNARWGQCVAGHEYAPAGEVGLRQWNRQQRRAEDNLATDVIDDDTYSVLNAIEERAEKWAFENQ